LKQGTALPGDAGQAEYMTVSSIILSIGQGGVALAGARLLQPQSAAFMTLDATGALAVAWGWLVLLALAFWVGILLCEGVALYGMARASSLLARARRQTRPLYWLCLAALFVGNIVALILQAAQLTAAPNLVAMGRILFASTYGALWLARTGLIILAVGLPLFTRRKRRTATVAGLMLAGLILLTLAYSGAISTTALTWFSLAAPLAWFGLFCYLACILLPLLRGFEPDRHGEMLIELLHRLYPLLLCAAGILFVSNIYLSESFPGTIGQFAASAQGEIELIRWLLAALMLVAGGYALFALRPRVARQAALLPVVDAELPARRARQSALTQTVRALQRASMLAAGLGALVLLCSTLLASAPNPGSLPGTKNSPAPIITPSPTASGNIVQSKRAGNLSITLEITPARVELANTVLVTLADTQSGKSVENAQITATTNMQVMDMGTTRMTMNGGKPVYRALFPTDSAFSMFGPWDVTLLIRQPGHAPVQVVFTVLLND
jgi:hypothetical protein